MGRVKDPSGGPTEETSEIALMRWLTLTCTAACVAALGASAAMAQTAGGYGQADNQDYQYAPGQYGPNPNVQAYDSYQRSRNAYDRARDQSARQHDAYDRQAADYRERQRAYQMDMNRYERARVAYDREYGPGAYEAYYARQYPPPSPY